MAYQYSANRALQLPTTDHQNGALSLPQTEGILNAFLDFVCEEETHDYLHLQKENYMLKLEYNQKQNVEPKKVLEDEVIRSNHTVSEVEEINKKQLEKIYVLENQLKAIRHILDGETDVDEVKFAETKPNRVVSELERTNKKQRDMISDLQMQLKSYRILCDGEKKYADTKLAGLEALNKRHLQNISTLKNKQDHDKEKKLLRSKIANLEATNKSQLKNISSNNYSKKVFEEKITRLDQINTELMVTRTKHLQKISDMEKQQASLDKALTNERKNFWAKVAELNAENKKHLEKIAALEKQKEACRRGACYGKKKVVEAKVVKVAGAKVVKAKGVETKLVNSQRLIIKKLCKVKNLNKWHVTLEKTNLSITYPNNLLFGDIVPGNQLVLKGFVTQYESDPFKNNAIVSLCDQTMVSRMLTNVFSCQLNEIYLCDQRLTWKEYQKLISSKTIQSFYFSGGGVLSRKGGDCAPLENILLSLPQVIRFAYLRIGNFNKGTFKNLIKLPSFLNLQEFKLDSINYQDFNAESFLMFMKKYPNVHITLGFVHDHSKNMVELNSLKQILLSHALANKLEIKFN